MVFIPAFIGVVLLSGFASALPRPQANPVLSTVAAPTSTLVPTDTTSQTATQTQSAGSSDITTSSKTGSYGDGSYGSGSYGDGSGAGNNNQWGSSSWSSLATSTASAYGSYSSPAYGSGSSNWGGSGYDDCVAQCVASFGAPAASYTPTATSASSDSMGSSGSGATITVIVAPTQGVLRYVPFAVNASVGDTIKFMWGANNHTVTKSSELTPCNKSVDALFASGTHDKDFVFTQVVNDTNPTFFYCGTPGHCQQGMFGIINPPNALGAPTSVSGMMSSLSANNSDVSAYASYTTKMTANDDKAARWGGNIDMASLPEWSHQFVAENVLFTRNFLASNSEVLKDDGFIDLSAAGSTPLMIPQDLSAALSNASPSSSATPSTPVSTDASVPSVTPVSASGSGAADSVSNGASSLVSPKALVGLFVAIATLFAL